MTNSDRRAAADATHGTIEEHVDLDLDRVVPVYDIRRSSWLPRSRRRTVATTVTRRMVDTRPRGLRSAARVRMRRSGAGLANDSRCHARRWHRRVSDCRFASKALHCFVYASPKSIDFHPIHCLLFALLRHRNSLNKSLNFFKADGLCRIIAIAFIAAHISGINFWKIGIGPE
jgi:hypothetical protein